MGIYLFTDPAHVSSSTVVKENLLLFTVVLFDVNGMGYFKPCPAQEWKRNRFFLLCSGCLRFGARAV